MAWIDIEQQRPPIDTRVIILLPFGMRVQDDTWIGQGWMNTSEYASHWMPINPPGTYTEIMQRPQGEDLLPVPPKRDQKKDWFTPAINEHMAMMDSLRWTQFMLRWEAMHNKATES